MKTFKVRRFSYVTDSDDDGITAQEVEALLRLGEKHRKSLFKCQWYVEKTEPVCSGQMIGGVPQIGCELTLKSNSPIFIQEKKETSCPQSPKTIQDVTLDDVILACPIECKKSLDGKHKWYSWSNFLNGQTIIGQKCELCKEEKK